MPVSEPSFVSCIISNNTSYTFGGGISAFSDFNLINCLITSNFAYDTVGGGIYLSNAGSSSVFTSKISNCTISKNNSYKGSAITLVSCAIIMQNNIVWDGTALSSDSKIFVQNFGYPDPVLTMHYNDIEGGEAEIETEGVCHIQWATGNIDSDPDFLDISNDDFSPGHLSPCIEAGNPDTTGLELPAVDLAGNARIVNDIVDMGCYEYPYPLAVKQQFPEDMEEPLVYPNPTKGNFNVDVFTITDPDYILICNLQGKIIRKIDIGVNTPEVIDVSDSPSGMYIVTVIGKKTIHSNRLILLD